MKNGKKAWKGFKKIAKKVGSGTKKAYSVTKPVVKRGYAATKQTYKVVKRDLGIKKSKKKKRWITSKEFNRRLLGY